MRSALLIAALAMLAGCNKAPVGNEPNGPLKASENRETPAVTAPGAGVLPSPSEGLRFVGRWAEDQKSCTTAASTFTQTTLTLPDGASCSLNRATQMPGGYDVQATCTAKGAPTGDLLKIRFAESAKAMLLDSEILGSKGLVFCGRDV
jgi:hypothetical protein